MDFKRKRFLMMVLLFSIFLCLIPGACTQRREKEKVIVTYSYCEGLPNMIKMNDEVIAKFEKENPDIKIKSEWGVNPQKHLTMFAGGVPPDISFWPWGPAQLVSRDVLLPLDGLIEKYNLDLSQYFPSVVDYYRYEGKIYLIPQQVKTIALIYNKDIFDKFGVPYPTRDWTWEDYYETARSLTRDTDGDGRRDYFGTQLPDPGMWVQLNGADVFNFDKGESLSPREKAKEALEFVVRLYRECCPQARELEAFKGYSGGFGVWSIEPFLTGKIAMVPAWAFMVRDTHKIKNFRWDTVPIPKTPDGKRYPIFYEGGLGIAKTSNHPEEAFRFIKYYSGEEGMLIYGRERNGVPAHIEAARQTFPSSPYNLSCFLEGMDRAKGYPLWIEPTAEDLTQDFSMHIDLVLLGEKSLDNAIQDISMSMENRYNKLVEKGVEIRLK